MIKRFYTAVVYMVRGSEHIGTGLLSITVQTDILLIVNKPLCVVWVFFRAQI